jgi:hypothetical protein
MHSIPVPVFSLSLIINYVLAFVSSTPSGCFNTFPASEIRHHVLRRRNTQVEAASYHPLLLARTPRASAVIST